MDRTQKLMSDQGEPFPDPKRYRRLVGKLIYLIIARPDLSFVVGVVSQFMQDPQIEHWKVVIHTFLDASKRLQYKDYCIKIVGILKFVGTMVPIGQVVP